MALDPERRRNLYAMKLRSLVNEHLSTPALEVVGTDDGASARLSDGGVAVLAEERIDRAIGTALALSVRSSSSEIEIFAEGASGVLARRAMLFSGVINIWEIKGKEIELARPDRPLDGLQTPELPALIAVMQGAGLEVVSEHGVIVGEVAGLEVARIVSDLNGDRIEVGVGAHDREAFALLHGHLPTTEAIARVADVVKNHRMPGAEPHPLNRLGAERWLRARLIAEPERIGAQKLEAAEPPVERTNLKEAVPAVAKGLTNDGKELVVVCAVGIDLDVLPFAADARLLHDPSAKLKVVVPQRDAHQILFDLAGRLVHEAEIVGVDDNWREWKPSPSVP